MNIQNNNSNNNDIKNLKNFLWIWKKSITIIIALISVLSLSWCDNGLEKMKEQTDKRAQAISQQLQNTINDTEKKLNYTIDETKKSTVKAINSWVDTVANNIKNKVNWKINEITNQTKDKVKDTIIWSDNILKQYNWVYKWNTVIKNFSITKRYLYKIYNNYLPESFRRTVYCWCKFNWKIVDKKSCWLKTKWYKSRSNRIEREHVVPAENFWRSFEERRNPKEFNKCKLKNWKYKSWRKCAETNPLFDLMEADLYNLLPSDWALNAYRSNYNIAEIPWEERKFWACDFEISNRKVEPPQNVKWNIARIYLYMQVVYWKKRWLKIISNKNEKLIEAWNKEDPIDKNECQVYYIKKKIQKNIDPILDWPCKKLLWK